MARYALTHDAQADRPWDVYRVRQKLFLVTRARELDDI